MLRWITRVLMSAIMIGLLVSNMLTLTSSAFNALLSGAIAGATGIKTLSHINKETLQRQRAAVKRMGTRMKARTVRMASRSTMGNSFSAIPIVGAAITVALAAWELAEFCEGLQELSQLYHELEIDDDPAPLNICKAPDEP